MQNFRVNRAYRSSLYFLLLTLISIGAIFLSDNLRLYVFTAVFVFSVPVLFLIAFLLRVASLDPSKRWIDIIFIFVGAILHFFISIMSHTCPTYVVLNGQTYPSLQWTPVSLIDICSPYNIFRGIQIMVWIFVFISVILALRFLILDLKKGRK